MKKKFDYSWVIVALCFMAICTSLGLCSSGRTMYLTAITEALDIKRSAFSLNDPFRYLTTTVLSLYFGTLFNKFGSKGLCARGSSALLLAIITAVEFPRLAKFEGEIKEKYPSDDKTTVSS